MPIKKFNRQPDANDSTRNNFIIKKNNDLKRWINKKSLANRLDNKKKLQ